MGPQTAVLLFLFFLNVRGSLSIIGFLQGQNSLGGQHEYGMQEAKGFVSFQNERFIDILFAGTALRRIRQKLVINRSTFYW